MHYQPIYELQSGRITALEALVRWLHPERGPLGPQSFIPFAEEAGLIDEIGEHVLEPRARRRSVGRDSFRPGTRRP